MRFILVLPFILCGCNPWNDIDAIKSRMKDCREFKPKLDGVPVESYTKAIQFKIDKCNKLKWGNDTK